MWLRRAFYRWLAPAALVLPLWLLVGWGVFQAGGWAFLWVLFIAIPSVLVGQTLLTLLVRARPSVRETRAVSWWDVLGFTLWHGLTIAVGCYPQSWFALLLTGAIAVGLALFWLMLWQLWSEAKGTGRVLRVQEVWSLRPDDVPAPAPQAEASAHEVIVLREVPPSER